jgi:hypothetical protein
MPASAASAPCDRPLASLSGRTFPAGQRRFRRVLFFAPHSPVLGVPEVPRADYLRRPAEPTRHCASNRGRFGPGIAGRPDGLPPSRQICRDRQHAGGHICSGGSRTCSKRGQAVLPANPFRSFGSVQMIGPAGTLGIVNVEASVPRVLGATEEERRQLIAYVLPFCAALAIVCPGL